MANSRKIDELERQFAENPRRYAAPFADALRKSDEVARALEVIRLGLELNPDYIPGSVILGRCHLDLGDDIAAEAAFSRVLDLDNENVIALKSLADIMERQGRTDEAIRFLAYLLDVDRSNDEAREQLNRVQAAAAGTGSGAAPRAPEPAPAAPAPADALFGAPGGELPPSPPVDMDALLEPTALWEPPAGAAEVASPSWYEPTASGPGEPPEFEARIVEEPVVPADLEPVAGLESSEFTAPAEARSYNEFFLEREEEIILTSHTGAEYQVANDSETLIRPAEEAAPFAAAPPPADEAPVVEQPASAGPVEEHPVPVEARAEPEVAAGAPETPAQPAEEAPFEWAMHVGEETGFVPAAPTHGGTHPPDSFDAAIEGIAPVDETAAPEDAEAAEGTGSVLEPMLVVTESMAELYAAQGHQSEALGVYRILFDRNPENERLRLRILDLEAALAAQVAADAAPSYAASVTGGRAVAAFLGGLLQSRPVPVELPEPPAASVPEVVHEAPPEGGEEAVASGEPTRPADDRLSLGAIFGEDPSPVPPASAAAGARSGGAGGFSFDDFFGKADSAPTGRSQSGTQRAVRSEDGDDLDQFHVWLQSLKR
jgi:tetratricopeptide (TPR) repeat protein